MLTWERKAVAPHGPIPTWIPSPHRWRHTVASRDMRPHCRTGCGWCLQPPGRYSWDGCTTELVETPTRKTCHRACGNTYTENMSQGLWKHLHGKHVSGLVETPTRKTCLRACGNTYMENMSTGLVETPTRKSRLRLPDNITKCVLANEIVWTHTGVILTNKVSSFVASGLR